MNARLHHALRLAEVVVRAASFEPGGRGMEVVGFVINMAKVFEDIVCALLRERLAAARGHAVPQATCYLDRRAEVRMHPDLVWCDDAGSPASVVDAKY